LTALDGAPDTTIPESLRDRSDPAFAEPWQARAFALAILASKQGCFTWTEWTHALALELRQASQPDSQSGGRSYFDCWLRALQALLVGKGAVASSELSERRRAWEVAYRQTPHGLPVSLSAARP
jgi:nitrile hydratase accessory protein